MLPNHFKVVLLHVIRSLPVTKPNKQLRIIAAIRSPSKLKNVEYNEWPASLAVITRGF